MSRLALLLTISLSVVACGSSRDTAFAPLPTEAASASTPEGDLDGPYPVVDVVDGDTAKVDIGGEIVTLRVIGLDTPETRHPTKPVQCFAQAASERADDLLAGRDVHLEEDPTQDSIDRYGRRLVHVWVDGVNFALVMINDGYGHEYTYEVAHTYTDEYEAAEADAASSGRGLWGPDTCAGDTEQPG